ncbi:MFS transporter [Rhodobium gokarnense]|uniref:MFS family permease n=1 Tax=Rhodobium gokarnense TaxID=364296 RepID=A0ABT3H7I6_9HYPH|nr:MFS transporter [Rhodobium gokarnense]MCW2306350.1 MFS family permease [Rhodobium gokarnense]
MTRDSWLILIVVCIAWIFDAADGTIFSLTMPLIRDEFQLSQSAIGLIGTMFLAGATLGSFTLPIIGEKYGRRWGMITCVGMYSVFTGAIGLAGSAFTVGVARFLTGIGTGGEWPIGATYLAEVVPPKKRGFWMGIMQSGYPLGYFLASVIFATVAALGLGWRACYFALVLPALVIIPVVSRFKESQAWVDRKNAADIDASKVWRTREGLSALFATPEDRKATIVASVLHVTLGVYGWGATIWLPSALVSDFGATSGQIGSVFIIIYAVATCGYLLSGWLQDRIGRRWCIILCLMLGMTAVVGLNVLRWMDTPSMMAVFALAVLLGFAQSTNTPLITYTSEIFSSKNRSMGLGFSVATGKVAAIMCPTVMGVIADYSSVSTALFYSTLFGWLAIPVALWGKETAGKTLA